MKKLVLFFSFLFLVSMAFGQTTTIDFETADDGYTASATEGSGTTDVFNRVQVTAFGGNSSYIWAVEDLSLSNPSLTLDQIDISAATNFSFSIDFLTPNTEDWDNTDELLITYSVDGGAYQNLMWVQSIEDETTYNDPAALDLAFDNTGDTGQELPAIVDDYGVGVGSNFETFSKSDISVSGSTLDITLQFNGLTSTAEGIYLDNIIIIGSTGSTPIITLSESSLTGFSYVVGSGPSSEQSFTAEGSDLTADITITAPTNYEISETSGSGYTSPITLTQVGGTVSTTTIYVRLKSGLSVGDYNSEVITASSAGATSKTVTCSGTVFNLEPTNHVTSFAATADGFSKIDLVWLENDGAVVPDGYLIKASTTTTITDPVDGMAIADNITIGEDSGAMNIAHGTNMYEWTWLDAETIYYFNVYPYTNSGTAIDYKTDGTIPTDDATTGVQPATPNVFFSEYIEGSSNNKALEIFNASGSTIDLADFAFWRISNGGDWIEGASNAVLPVGTLADGTTWVICNSAADPLIQAVSDSIGSTITYFNGDDAVGLAYIGFPDEPILIDAIGEEGPDVGTAWDVAGTTNATLNHTLVRKSSVTTGNTDWASSAGTNATNSEWVVYPQDTWDDLGSHTFGGNALPLISNITRNPVGDVTSSTTVSVSANVTDSDGTISLVELHWGLTSGSLTNTIFMSSVIADLYTTDSDIPAQVVGTTVYYEVYAEDDVPESSVSAEYDYTVVAPSSTTLPYLEPFDADLGICYTYSDSGASKEWYWSTYSGNGYAAMNGYNSGVTEEDWLILPGIDFDSYSNEVMTFDTWYNYGSDDATNYLKLLYSSDYPGLGDPSGYSWTELAFTHPSGSSTWTASGDIDLSAIIGTSVYIAFKYRYEVDNWRWWEVDNISISIGTLDPPANVVITHNGTDAIISWDAVTGATTYKIYSDTDPYGSFSTMEIEISGLTWTDFSTTGEKKFYHIVAVN